MRTTALLIVLSLLGLLVSACAGDAQQAATPEAAVSQAAASPEVAPVAAVPTEPAAATPTLESPTDMPIPEPTNTPVPTNTPEPVYTDPDVLAEIEGVGGVVTDNFEWPQCQKAVFYWTSLPGDVGAASLIATLYNVTAGLDTPLVNEFAMNVSDSLSGAVLQPLQGGEYYIATENTEEQWTVRVECQDGVAPVASGLDIQGAGNIVTDNYALVACSKSVFVWAVEPGDLGTASLIASLCKAGEDQCQSLVNEFDMDLTAPLEGEALQSVTDGAYYLAISNTSGNPWRIRWECRD